jgi:peptide/nickel transport system permease protein
MATAPSGSPSGELLIPAGPPAAARPRRALIPQFGGIWGFIFRRILLSVLVLFIVSLIVFAATQALGDPARAILGRQATPDSLKALRDQLNLDRSLFSQYWSWLTGLLHGDAGVSMASAR